MLSCKQSRRRPRIFDLAVTATAVTLVATLSGGTVRAEPRAIHDGLEAAPASAEFERPLLDVCPLAGPSTFEDSWGWARSGGRRHQGVDLIADRGTPIVAVRDGEAQFKTNGLGGRAIWLTTSTGDEFYYAHLSDWAGESRTVTAGEVIGYVGSSGNAKGPHLHFETHPGGQVVNPYPETLGACVPTPDELAAMSQVLADSNVRVATRF